MTFSLKKIKCRAAVMYDYAQPLVLENVLIDAPREDQVRVKLISAGICLTDITVLNGKFKLSKGKLPIVLGHEGVGVVESIGDKVSKVKVGDRVLTSYVNRCGDCRFCSMKSLTNLCARESVIALEKNQNKKLVKNGQILNSYGALGTFCEYVLLKSSQIEKIDSQFSKIENLSAISCATGSGFGASKYLAQVVPGSSVAVWGCNAFGLNVAFGARLNGAKDIIVIDDDCDEDRKELAREFGCTEFINPKDLNQKSMNQYLLDTYGGVDYAFDCTGDPENLPVALKSLTPYGSFIFVALTHSDTELVYPTGELAFGKRILGGFFGNQASEHLYEEVLRLYRDGVYELDKMITSKFKLDQINEAVESVESGRSVKTLIVFD